ncbi:MAG: methyltransferase domain-containing protein [Dehalococcoidales bacterium]
MALIILYVFLALLGAVGIWQLAVLAFETRDKNRKFRAAVDQAGKEARPLLVVGGPWGSKPARRWLNKPAHGAGDVCLDIDPRAIHGHPAGVVASVTRIPFGNGTFGAVFASHLLEHLATTGDARLALEELHRVAARVFIVCPSRQSIAGWVIPEHRLWVWQKGDEIYLKQRGESGKLEVYRC